MKFFKTILKDKSLDESMKEIWDRFPASIIIMIIGVGILFYVLDFTEYDSDTEQLVRVLLALILSFFMSVGSYLAIESGKLKEKFETLKHLVPLVFIVLFYSGLNGNIESFENVVFFFLSLAGILSILFFAPYVSQLCKQKIHEQRYYGYFYKISVVFLMSSIVGAILAALGTIAIASVLTLFDLYDVITDKIFGDWLILALAFISPLFGLTQIPSKSEIVKMKNEENKFFSFIVKFIAIPFISCYFLILYAYSAKVLINFSQWPKGEVSWMVIGFSVFAYITYIFAYTFDTENDIISRIRKALPYVVFPQVFMLFYAIYLRINQYDITINRYFVVVFGLWLGIISLYYIFSKAKKLIIIPTTLTLFSIIISIGPWSVYNLPESRQLSRLTNNLIEANILQAWAIVPLVSEDDISPELSKEIYEGINYLCAFDNCNSMKALFPKIYADILKEDKEEFEKFNSSPTGSIKVVNNGFEDETQRQYQGPNSWTIVRGITDAIKVKNHSSVLKEQEYIYVSLDYSQSFFPIDTRGFSEMYEFRGDNEVSNMAVFNINTKRLILPNGNSYDVSKVMKQLVELFNTPGLKNPINNPDLLKFQVEDAYIFIRNINLENPQFTGEKSNFPYHGAQGYILIK